MLGRVADAVVLSDEERRFLEGQVRRHKAPRSLSDRCRMILLCADGLASKDVAGQQGLQVHLIMDNYATHKTPKIKAWLARRPH